MTAASTPSQRVALFQLGWPVQSHTVSAAIVLAKAGYAIDLFLFNAPSYVDLESLKRWETIRVYDLADTLRPHVHQRPALPRRLVRGVGRRLRSFLTARQAYWLWPPSRQRLVPPAVVSNTLALVGHNRYSCLIGIEKKGLIWAGQIADHLGAPLVYYSLELYTKDWTEDYPVKHLGGPVYFRRLREAEAHYHRKASATIVQTPERARVLFEDTGAELSDANTLYVPCSLPGPPSSKRTTVLHDLLGLRKDQLIVLYIGLISDHRYALELTRAAQQFHDDWTLVMHGWGEADTVRQIRDLDTNDKVALSLEMVDSDQLGDVVASAAVGVALYRPTPLNDRLTAFASEKMALYMRHGVPFVSFDYEEYRDLAQRSRCGEVLAEVDDLPRAVGTILASHMEYRANATSAFAAHYDVARNFQKVIDGIERLP
jgi:glycosyltransferase involved in cell wall biosynthesis